MAFHQTGEWAPWEVWRVVLVWSWCKGLRENNTEKNIHQSYYIKEPSLSKYLMTLLLSLSLSQCDLEPSLLKVKDINNLQYKYVDTHKREIYLVLYYEQINEWMHNKSINKDIYICVCICKANGCSGSRVLSLCSQVYRQQIQPHNNQALFFGQFTFSIFVLLEKQVQTKPIMGQHLPEAKSTIVASNTRL